MTVTTEIPDANSYLFADLLRFALPFCAVGLFVDRHLDNPELAKIVQYFERYMLSSDLSSEWPGTKLSSSKARVYKFKFNEESMSALLKFSSSLEDWIEPNLPEDLCLMRADDSSFLTSITHEGDFFLTLTKEEATLFSSKFGNPK